MGSHWVYEKTPELHGQPFTHTFIYGTYDGKVIFIEPMVAKSFLEQKPSVKAPIPQPSSVHAPDGTPLNTPSPSTQTARNSPSLWKNLCGVKRDKNKNPGIKEHREKFCLLTRPPFAQAASAPAKHSGGP